MLGRMFSRLYTPIHIKWILNESYICRYVPVFRYSFLYYAGVPEVWHWFVQVSLLSCIGSINRQIDGCIPFSTTAFNLLTRNSSRIQHSQMVLVQWTLLTYYLINSETIIEKECFISDLILEQFFELIKKICDSDTHGFDR